MASGLAKLQPVLWLIFIVGIVPASGHAVWKTDGSSLSKRLWVGHAQNTVDQTVPTQSYQKEKKNPFAGVIAGVLLWCIVPACLWNNERIAIKQYKMQFKAERWAIHIDDEKREPLKEMDGRIVYLSGVSTCTESLEDSQFPKVKSEGKIKLRRNFQMYQWVEKEKEEGEGDNKRTVYYWVQEWSDVEEKCPHDDSGAHQNPSMPFPSTKRQAPYRAFYDGQAGNGDLCAEASHDKVHVGAYYLGELVIRELLNWKEKEVTADMLKGLNHKGMSKEPVQKDGWWYWGDASNEIGKLRVSFEELCPGPISIVGVLVEVDAKGWTFAPIKRPDSAGTGDGCLAEFNCPCVKVREALHFGEEEDDEGFKEDLKSAPVELSKKEQRAFHKSKTAAKVEEYAIEEDFSDLCCVGPFGGLVIQFMHYLGLEEEFLAVREKQMSLDTVMKTEGDEAANRHHMARIAGFFLLLGGAFMIISPIVKILNFHWIATLLGGGLISVVLCCAACLCSVSCFSLIVSVAWIVHRPFLASLGILTAVAIVVGVYIFVYDEEKKAAGQSPSVQAAFLVARHTFLRGMAHI